MAATTRRALRAGWWLTVLYGASGATGLAYEVLWARMLTAQFGLSIFGIAATVASFLLGLGIGAATAAAVLERSAAHADAQPRALARYALLELAVALYALALPPLFAGTGPWIDVAAAHLSWQAWCALQGALALLLLGLPAAAIGATFPLVLRAQVRSPVQLARLYAANSLGAAAGALLSLALLAALAWTAAVQTVALAGLAIAAGAYALRRSGALPDMPAERAVHSAGRLASPWRTARHEWAYAGVGACAILLEIAWTRLYGLVMLRTEYVLAIILAVYLLGTALGSALAARERPWMATAVPLAAGLGTLLGLWVLAPLSLALQGLQFTSLGSALAVQALALAGCTLPVTMALGAWLPLLAARAARGAGRTRPAMRLYAANCLGGAAGAALTVAWLIPAAGATGSIALAAVLLLLLGMTLGRHRVLLAVLPVTVLGAYLLRDLPSPARLLGAERAGGTVRFRYEDALSLNHVIEMPDGQRTLLTDLQHLDAASDPPAVALQADQARLPLLLHPHPHSVLFLGLGTGVTASGSLAWPALARTAVEISPGAVSAARDWFAPVNGKVLDSMQVWHDDVRHFLAASMVHFDVIVGDLFHPDLAGTGNLLSVEQFARARACLNPGGLFAQWLALNQFDRASLHVVLRSFQHVFPDGVIYLDGAHLAMVGSRGAMAAAPAMQASLDAAGPWATAATGGEGAATWLGRYWGPIAAGVGELQSEARPVIEFRLPRLRYDDSAGFGGAAGVQTAPPVAQILLELLRQRPEAQQAATQLGVPAGEQAAFSSAYAASELAVQAWLAVIASDEHRSRGLVRLAFEANPHDRWIASSLADDLFESARQDGSLDQAGTLERILRIYPDHTPALRALWHRANGRTDAAADAARTRLQSLMPLDNEFAAIGVRSH